MALRTFESTRRTQHFLRLLAEGKTPHQAAEEARVTHERVVQLLGEPTFRSAFVTLTEAKAA